MIPSTAVSTKARGSGDSSLRLATARRLLDFEAIVFDRERTGRDALGVARRLYRTDRPGSRLGLVNFLNRPRISSGVTPSRSIRVLIIGSARISERPAGLPRRANVLCSLVSARSYAVLRTAAGLSPPCKPVCPRCASDPQSGLRYHKSKMRQHTLSLMVHPIYLFSRLSLRRRRLIAVFEVTP
jgi:hypothetical protein